MNKKVLYFLLLCLGVIIIVASFLLIEEPESKTLQGIGVGVGSGLIGLSFSQLMMQMWYKKHPDELRQSEIDLRDERNEMIRNKAKAQGGIVIQWLVMILAWIMILLDYPLWIVLTLIGIFLVKNIYEMIVMSIYNKKM